jgi:hypothetical protein
MTAEEHPPSPRLRRGRQRESGAEAKIPYSSDLSLLLEKAPNHFTLTYG